VGDASLITGVNSPFGYRVCTQTSHPGVAQIHQKLRACWQSGSWFRQEESGSGNTFPPGEWDRGDSVVLSSTAREYRDAMQRCTLLNTESAVLVFDKGTRTDCTEYCSRVCKWGRGNRYSSQLTTPDEAFRVQSTARVRALRIEIMQDDVIEFKELKTERSCGTSNQLPLLLLRLRDNERS
jgi:hypothetical protein